MPAFRCRNDHRALVFKSERGQRLGFRLRLRHLLDDAAFGVQPVEFSGDPGCFGDVAFQQQPDTEIGAADPAAGVDARPEHKAEVPGFRRAVQPRHVHQRGMTDMIAAPHRDQAFGNESPVESGQRRDIGDSAERHVVQHAQQIGLRHFAGPEFPISQFPVDRNQRHQHETDRGELAEA